MFPHYSELQNIKKLPQLTEVEIQWYDRLVDAINNLNTKRRKEDPSRPEVDYYTLWWLAIDYQNVILKSNLHYILNEVAQKGYLRKEKASLKVVIFHLIKLN